MVQVGGGKGQPIAADINIDIASRENVERFGAGQGLRPAASASQMVYWPRNAEFLDRINRIYWIGDSKLHLRSA